MAFRKTSVALTRPTPVTPPPSPEIGDMQVEVEGGLEVWKVWNGEAWEAAPERVSHTPQKEE